MSSAKWALAGARYGRHGLEAELGGNHAEHLPIGQMGGEDHGRLAVVAKSDELVDARDGDGALVRLSRIETRSDFLEEEKFDHYPGEVLPAAAQNRLPLRRALFREGGRDVVGGRAVLPNHRTGHPGHKKHHLLGAFAAEPTDQPDEATQQRGNRAVDDAGPHQPLAPASAAAAFGRLQPGTPARRGVVGCDGQSVTMILPKTSRASRRAKAASMSPSPITESMTGCAIPAAILSSTVARLRRLQPKLPISRSCR